MKRLSMYGSILGLMLLLGAVAAACGGGGDDEPTPTATSTAVDPSSTAATSTAAPTRTATPGAALGTVDNADGNARVNNARANQNLKLRAGDRIQTGKDSSIDFTLTGAPAVECKTRSDSDIVVKPDDNTQLQWKSRSGVSFCDVERGSPPVAASFGIDPNVTIEVEGTLFGISEQGTLRVVEGFVVVRTGSKTERIGPNEGVPLLAAGGIGPKETWQGLINDEQALVDDLQTRRQPTSLEPTDTEYRQSRLLDSIRRNESLRVLLDSSATDDDENFMWSYFGRLLEEWVGTSDDLDIQRVNAREAPALLAQYPNSVFVSPATASATATPTPYASPKPGVSATPTPTPVANLDRVPFYIGANGTAWNIGFAKDASAVAAFARYTRGILYTGIYFDMYFGQFNEAPSYNRLLQIVP